MAAGMLTKIACVVVACMVLFAPHANALTCRQVVATLPPCLKYLQDGGPLPPVCCKGVRRLNNLARTTADRRTACGCVKSWNGYTKHIKTKRAIQLPGKCGINLPYMISTRTDCTRAEVIGELKRFPRLHNNLEAMETTRVLKRAQQSDMEKATRL
ncbi:non-specific lipid-transfer protein-like protein [Tanacetum coccineum]